MATIVDIKYTEMVADKYATISFSNGAAMFCRLVRHNENEDLILTPSKKLVAINLATKACEVLATGVSIR